MVEGPDLPATRPARPDSRNCRFQFPTDCSETFARRAASATVTSPARIDNTIADLLLSRERRRPCHERSDSLPGQTRKQRALPESLTRDTVIRGPPTRAVLRGQATASQPAEAAGCTAACSH